MVLPELASEAAGARTNVDTFLQKTAQLYCYCSQYRSKDTVKQLVKRVHSIWSRAADVPSRRLLPVVKTDRISSAVEDFLPMFA